MGSVPNHFYGENGSIMSLPQNLSANSYSRQGMLTLPIVTFSDYPRCLAVICGSYSWQNIDLYRSLVIQGAADSLRPAIENVGIDHSGLHIFVAQQFLHGSDIVA